MSERKVRLGIVHVLHECFCHRIETMQFYLAFCIFYAIMGAKLI